MQVIAWDGVHTLVSIILGEESNNLIKCGTWGHRRSEEKGKQYLATFKPATVRVINLYLCSEHFSATVA